MIYKIQEIVSSFHNGQKKQMVQQIKDYGQVNFFVEFYPICQGEGHYIGMTNKLYAEITYTFFLLK